MTWIGSSRVPFSDIGMTQEKMDLLDGLAYEDDYWMKACLFVKAVTYRKLSSLSDHQRRWLTTIIMDLGDRLYKRSWRY